MIDCHDPPTPLRRLILQVAPRAPYARPGLLLPANPVKVGWCTRS